ncbi:hypothetical protein C1S99_08065 [Vibrio parahaemolyticus]|uniref:hypothetical protein n=1 Tax=Vibrio parahaemolyticus TaxID=670 RepID=UPI000C86BF5F|nr:hypothetical protein [Vibrio parahaemolyticus]MCX8816028.1 hypothetical protein [Vibrio parahaemolyticus]PMS43835.1 hypothetical protein C1T12_00215 [Vibrio parahaemolyticus]PMS64225.1 hypothetical protein C1S91_00215 [Vibrio parahaemolyticus]PMS70160.1 hypothetical protein C1S96_02065 [Vibrio parahaemolyticus]PMS75512.1 hypothetical protein C1T10_00215 [Vibrio parahaemolyticus]
MEQKISHQLSKGQYHLRKIGFELHKSIERYPAFGDKGASKLLEQVLGLIYELDGKIIDAVLAENKSTLR